jgi:hypothetical protein
VTARILGLIAAALLAGGMLATGGCAQAQPRSGAKPMNADSVIASLLKHDHMLLREPAIADPALLPRIAAELPKFDEQSKALTAAYLEKYDSRESADLLLRMTRENVQVAAAAARTLNKLSTVPAPDALLAAIPLASDKYVRGQLYLVTGKSKAPVDLDKLRNIARSEKNPEALADLLAAVVKLGGSNERTTFLNLVRQASADQVIRIQEHLLYVNDVRFAKGLLPWFDSNDGVMRIGSDRQGGMMARKKDFAVWIAHQLGVKFQPAPTYLTNFGDADIAAARKAVQALPDA